MKIAKYLFLPLKTKLLSFRKEQFYASKCKPQAFTTTVITSIMYYNYLYILKVTK